MENSSLALIYNSRNLYKVLNINNREWKITIYNSRNLYKVLNSLLNHIHNHIYNSRNLYKVLNKIWYNISEESTIVEIYIRY